MKETDSKIFYDLNKRALTFRNSKEYFIGERIITYIKILKKGKIIKFAKQFTEDVFRVLFKKKKNPKVDELDFSKHYIGKKIAVYTCIYGEYDNIIDPLYKDPNCDYYIFTDQKISEDSIWKKIDFDFPKEVNSNFLKNRYVKIFPHKIFEEYDYSIYVDGNLIITSEISLYLKEFNTVCGIGMHKHPSNTGIYEEVDYNLRLNKITSDEAKLLRKKYYDNNMPSNYGMFECNVIVREHFNTKCIEIMDMWWNEIINGVKRDQLYFTYILYKLKLKFEDVYLLGDNINANPMFIRERHK